MQSLALVESWIPRMLAMGLPGVFLVLLAFWATAAVILDYHWRRYAPNRQAAVRFRICFYGASLACVFAAAISQILFFI